MNMSRRSFLATSAATALAACATTRESAHGANDRIQVGVIGLNGRGGSLMNDVLGRNDAEIVALCDPDANVLGKRAEQARSKSNKRPETYADMRELLANDRVDAVMVATPNHWHTLAAVWALQAGKDVYVEKPLSHSIGEGRILAQVASTTGRVVQHGTQSRSDTTLIRDIGLIHEGFIGDIVHSRGYVYKNGNREAIGFGQAAEPPDHLDWTLWQGPAQEKPYLQKDDGSGLLVHYNWHWFWDYGNGEIANQGVHEMDIAVWGHNRGLPVRVQSTGGRYGWDDQGETPNTQTTAFTYSDGSILTFEVRNLGSYYEGGGGQNGDSFFGTEGYYVRDAGFFDYKNKSIPVRRRTPDRPDHLANWLEAIRAQDPSMVHAPAEAGHLSCAHCHIGNVAYRMGRSLEFEPETERFVDDAANSHLLRQYRDGFEPKA